VREEGPATQVPRSSSSTTVRITIIWYLRMVTISPPLIHLRERLMVKHPPARTEEGCRQNDQCSQKGCFCQRLVHAAAFENSLHCGFTLLSLFPLNAVTVPHFHLLTDVALDHGSRMSPPQPTYQPEVPHEKLYHDRIVDSIGKPAKSRPRRAAKLSWSVTISPSDLDLFHLLPVSSDKETKQ
jgi:hypothetical protein